MDLVAQVLRAIEVVPVNPSEFERCACALLRTRYPGLSAVEGGHDFGRDGDIYIPFDVDDLDQRGRLLATVGDPVANLRTGLRRMAAEGLRVDLVVIACLRMVNARTRAQLDELCTEHGVPAPHVYARDWFVAALVSEPDWRQRLLGVGGQLGPLLDQPLDALELTTPAPVLVGRDADQSTLRTLVADGVDVVLVGVPGVGKTRLTSELGEDIVFLQDSDAGQVLDAVMHARPAAIVVDDAHARAPEVRILRRIRVQEQVAFSIIANTWPDVSDDVLENLPDARVVSVDLVERAEMDRLIRSVGVTGHRARVVVLDQGEGRPGWALALCEVLIGGGGQDVLAGAAHLANVERYLRKVTESRTAMDTLACVAALGIVSSEIAHRLASLVGLAPAELTGVLDRLARHGLLDRAAHGWSVQPALRAPLVARWFFSEPAQHPWTTLVTEFPDHHRAFTFAAIVAARTGSAVARKAVDDAIRSRPAPATAEEIDFGLLSEYATLDEHAAGHVVSLARTVLAGPRPTRQIGRFSIDLVARPVTTLLTGVARRWLLPDAVSTLLDLAIGDASPRHSTPDHPLRVLGDLARTIDPDHGTSVWIREQLLTCTLTWLTAKPVPERWIVATEVLATIFSPEVSGTWVDPANPNTVSFAQGYDTATNLQQLLDLWPRVDDLFVDYPHSTSANCPPEALCPLIDLVTEWFQLAAGVRFSATELHTKQKQAGRTGACRILETLRPAVQAAPGLAARAQRVLDNRPSDDHDDDPPTAFQLDPDLIDLLGDTREPDQDTTNWLAGKNARLDQLAQRIVMLGPTAGTRRFAELTRSAELAAHAPDGNATVLALRMAPNMTDPASWFRLANRDRTFALLHAALQQTLEHDPGSATVEEFTAHLDDSRLRPAIVSVALNRPDLDEFAHRVIITLDTGDVPLLDHYLRLGAPTDVLHLLLSHHNPAIAAAAALAFADAQPHGPVLPEEWKDDWRAAIQDMRVDDMDQHTRWKAERLLKHLATQDPDLLERWFARQLDHQSATGFLHPPEPYGCEGTPRLPTPVPP